MLCRRRLPRIEVARPFLDPCPCMPTLAAVTAIPASEYVSRAAACSSRPRSMSPCIATGRPHATSRRPVAAASLRRRVPQRVGASIPSATGVGPNTYADRIHQMKSSMRPNRPDARACDRARARTRRRSPPHGRCIHDLAREAPPVEGKPFVRARRLEHDVSSLSVERGVLRHRENTVGESVERCSRRPSLCAATTGSGDCRAAARSGATSPSSPDSHDTKKRSGASVRRGKVVRRSDLDGAQEKRPRRVEVAPIDGAATGCCEMARGSPRESFELRVVRVELAAVEMSLLEVVADDLVTLDEVVRREPVGKALVQLRPWSPSGATRTPRRG